jgi:hypothetical protein
MDPLDAETVRELRLYQEIFGGEDFAHQAQPGVGGGLPPTDPITLAFANTADTNRFTAELREAELGEAQSSRALSGGSFVVPLTQLYEQKDVTDRYGRVTGTEDDLTLPIAFNFGTDNAAEPFFNPGTGPRDTREQWQDSGEAIYGNPAVVATAFKAWQRGYVAPSLEFPRIGELIRRSNTGYGDVYPGINAPDDLNFAIESGLVTSATGQDFSSRTVTGTETAPGTGQPLTLQEDFAVRLASLRDELPANRGSLAKFRGRVARAGRGGSSILGSLGDADILGSRPN